MEIASGVFVSSVTTADGWTPDPDVGGEMHELHHEGVWAGLSRFTDIDGYFAIRRRTIALEVCFDLSERVNHYELRPRLAADSRMAAMKL